MRIGNLFLVVAAGCGFQTPALVDDAPPLPPDGGVTAISRFDSAAELRAPGHVLKDMTIEARGSLTPNAYTYGGLIVRGLQGTRLWSNEDNDWSKINAVTAAGAGLWRGEQLNNGTQFAYLGITDDRIMTIWFEGEVWLEQGTPELFLLRGNDAAFIELARPGTTSYTRKIKSGNDPVAVPVEETGWHPIRIGFGDADDSRLFEFLHGATPATLVPWARDRLRARAGDLAGTLRNVFNGQILGGGIGLAPPVARFEPGDLLTEPSFSPRPPGIQSDDNWSARYFGQLYIDQPGMYTLTVSSDDGNRVRLGAARGLDSWARNDGNGEAATTLNTMLGAGWHDLTIDYNQLTGPRHLIARITGGGFTGGPVPRDRLRPVEPSDDRLVFSSDVTVEQINATGTIIADLPVVGFAGETVKALELTYQIDSDRWSELEIKLERPGLAPVTIRPLGTALSSGSETLQLSLPNGAAELSALLDGPAAGPWKLHIIDGNGGGGGRTIFQNAQLTLHTAGGPPTIAPAASWTSPVIASPTNVFAVDSVTWDARLQDGSRVEAAVRTCTMADCSDDPPWSAPVTPGTPLAVTERPYLQVRVDLFSNGTLEPELQALNVTYRRVE
jgi:PA14 domain